MRCYRCARPAEAVIANRDYCGMCWSSFRAEMIAAAGIARVRRVGGEVVIWEPGGMVQVGAARLDHGPGQFEVACPVCEATTIGHLGESCPWCERRTAQLVAEQRAILLAGPGVEDEDARRAWAHRLASAVRCDLITEDEARSVWRRGERRRAS